jgi:hypothetical protein
MLILTFPHCGKVLEVQNTITTHSFGHALALVLIPQSKARQVPTSIGSSIRRNVFSRRIKILNNKQLILITWD